MMIFGILNCIYFSFVCLFWLLFILQFKNVFYFWKCVCVPTYTLVSAVPTETKLKHWIPWTWSFSHSKLVMGFIFHILYKRSIWSICSQSLNHLSSVYWTFMEMWFSSCMASSFRYIYVTAYKMSLNAVQPWAWLNTCWCLNR